MENVFTIALSKGRIFKETLPLLAHAGIVPKDDPESSRKLILDTNQDDVKLVIIMARMVVSVVSIRRPSTPAPAPEPSIRTRGTPS